MNTNGRYYLVKEWGRIVKHTLQALQFHFICPSSSDSSICKDFVAPGKSTQQASTAYRLGTLTMILYRAPFEGAQRILHIFRGGGWDGPWSRWSYTKRNACKRCKSVRLNLLTACNSSQMQKAPLPFFQSLCRAIECVLPIAVIWW